MDTENQAVQNQAVVLETARLRLRPLRLSDAPRIQALFPHWEVVQYMAAVIPWPYPENGAQQFLELMLPKNEAGTQYDWAIMLRSNDSDQLIGLISLYPNSAEDSRGFWLGEAYQRQGYMTEAVTAVNDFAFGTLGMPVLMLNNAEPNRVSHRIKEISGASIVAIEEDTAFVGGRFRKIRWRLTREDWEAHRDHSNPKEP